MMSQRVGITAMRGAAKPFFAQNVPKMALAARLPTMQSRPVATTKVTPTEGNEILAKQRLNRPVAPHLGIYKKNQTFFSHSAWTRITGCTLSGVAYAYFAAYLVSPLVGWHLESASLASAFAAMPLAISGGIKFLLGFPFTYHFINGCRHLVFDLGKGFNKASFARAETFLWSASVLGGLFLAFGL